MRNILSAKQLGMAFVFGVLLILTPSVVWGKDFRGRGQQATAKFTLDSGLHVFRMKHDGKRNFNITLLDNKGDWVELLVNKIGSFEGSKAVGIERKGSYILDISADGRWTVAIE